MLRTGKGREKSVYNASRPATSAAMLDSSNFVLYANDSDVIWNSFYFPTDTILGGQILSLGRKIVSSVSTSDHSSGHFSLNMQSDGSLVAYPVNNSQDDIIQYWSPNYGVDGDAELILTRLGVLFLNTSSYGVRILANGSYPDKDGTNIYRATLDADGLFRFGFCGLNSYCSAIDSKADCNCYPGFDFVNTSNKFLGCHQNFNEDDCRRKNMWWTDRPYSVKLMEEKACGKSCLEDCNCGALLYMDAYCSKYKLPLRYGRATKPTIAFFKVYHPHQVHEVLIESKRSLILILSIILGSFLCLCLVLATSSILVYRHKFDRYRKLTENVNLGLAEEFTLWLFSYSELESATEGFQEELGRGSYGARLEKDVEEGDREFRAEIIAIARTHHKNLVRVLGICIEGNRKLLVYEYMNNGSLVDLIFKAERPPIWKERIRIALDVARGLLYLHEESEVRIIHCNIKPQNILMDDNWTAKISDFGFAKLLMPNQSGATTAAKGTSAYLAPEWEKNSLISFQIDIYSLGVVLLEIVCCRRSIEVNVSTTDEIILSSWVYDCFAARELDKLVKDESVDFRTLERMVKVGLWCVQEDPTLRPSMKNVVLMLEGTINVPIPPSPVHSIVVS
ncbi:hypothetical protein ACJW31_06G031900 [Castanea mollissima]